MYKGVFIDESVKRAARAEKIDGADKKSQSATK